MRAIPGAVDVVADQTVGKAMSKSRSIENGPGATESTSAIFRIRSSRSRREPIDHCRGRERYPVRLRYARDYRADEQSIKSILVTSGGMGGRRTRWRAARGTVHRPCRGGERRRYEIGRAGDSSGAPSQCTAVARPTVYLSDVADVQVVPRPVAGRAKTGF
jgi:Cu(I)/Ag(I) efflux system membrane protein CusA/SilA